MSAAEAHKTRVLFLTSDLGGGTGNHLLEMMKYWDPALWEKRIISDAKLTARIDPGASVDFLSPRTHFDRYPLSQIHRFRQIISLVKEARPHILHAYFFWPIIYGRLLRLTGRVSRLVENREDQGFNWGRHEYLLLRLTRFLPDKVVCVSEAVRKTVREKEGVSPDKLIVIQNGVAVRSSAAPDFTARAELGIKADNQVVGMVANFNRAVKGVEHFVDSMPLILTQCPSAVFLLLGRGKYEDDLRARARSLGVEKSLIFAGFRKDIERFYGIMNVSVLTSLSEGLSITLLESMVHGIPVVATAVGGNPELVIDGQTGFLVPPRDVLQFSEKVVKLLKDPALAAQLGEAGRKHAAAQFNIQKTAERYCTLYRELAESTDRVQAGG